MAGQRQRQRKKKLHFQIVNCMTYCLMVSLRMLFLWSKWGKKSRSIEENPSLWYISIAILQQITGALTILFSFYFSLVSPPLLPIICYYFYTFCLFISAYYLWIFIYTGSYSRTCVHFTFFFYIKLHLKQENNCNNVQKRYVLKWNRGIWRISNYIYICIKFDSKSQACSSIRRMLHCILRLLSTLFLTYFRFNLITASWIMVSIRLFLLFQMNDRKKKKCNEMKWLFFLFHAFINGNYGL